MNNIYPIFNDIIGRTNKESRLNQRGLVIWLIGLSGSGKSTIAAHLERKLFAQGFLTQILDGDNLRSGLNGDLGFSHADRAENLRRTAEVAKLLKELGIVTITSFITPTEEARRKARSIIGEADYIEVFVNCPLEVCEARDVKGLYAKARRGEIPEFTGVTAPFETPASPDITVDSANVDVDLCVDQILENILDKIQLNQE